MNQTEEFEHTHPSIWGAATWVVVLLLLTSPATGAELPQFDGETHLGVKTCSGKTCHGRLNPSADDPVFLDEATMWREEDAHARAYSVLNEPISIRIAQKLGLKEPAHEADLCLDCHSNNVPAKRRGPQFTLETGVGCEACHGGAGRWVKRHAASLPHADNIDFGMFPTDDPVARAELCLSCHFGMKEQLGVDGRTRMKFVNHRLMGAGHPRQSFELHVFSQIQPAHYQIDGDYIARGKQAPKAVQVWAIGQAVAVRHMLDALIDVEMSQDGAWPEFVLFDCHACHHPISDNRWRPRPSVGLGPGLARINDSSFLMLRHSIEILNPKTAKKYKSDVRSLHRLVSRSLPEARAKAEQLRVVVISMIDTLSAWKIDTASMKKLAKSIATEGAGGEYIDYVGAEQATMALQVLVDGLFSAQAYDSVTLQKLDAELAKLLKATESPESYRPKSIRSSLKQMQRLL